MHSIPSSRLMLAPGRGPAARWHAMAAVIRVSWMRSTICKCGAAKIHGWSVVHTGHFAYVANLCGHFPWSERAEKGLHGNRILPWGSRACPLSVMWPHTFSNEAFPKCALDQPPVAISLGAFKNKPFAVSEYDIQRSTPSGLRTQWMSSRCKGPAAIPLHQKRITRITCK